MKVPVSDSGNSKHYYGQALDAIVPLEALLERF